MLSGRDIEAVPELRAIDQRGHRRAVLVVDNELVQTLVQRALGIAGFQTVAALNADEAIRLCADRELALMICPRGVAGRLIDTMRRDHPGLPVIVLSGIAGAATARGHCDGITLLEKPFTRVDLLLAVSDALGDE